MQPCKARPRGETLWEISSRKIKTLKKEIVVVVLERNKLKQKKMDKTGKQQQKRTELYKFKRNSLIPD